MNSFFLVADNEIKLRSFLFSNKHKYRAGICFGNHLYLKYLPSNAKKNFNYFLVAMVHILFKLVYLVHHKLYTNQNLKLK